MSHTRVKTTYEQTGAYGALEIKTLYCHHNHSSDFTTFYDEDGDVAELATFSSDDTKWEAMQDLWYPFKNEWNTELKDGVEYYTYLPNEISKV